MKKRIVKSVSILILGMVLVFFMGLKTNANAASWTCDKYGQWYYGKKAYYIWNNNTLVVSPFAPHSMGVQHKLASWKMDGAANLKIVSGLGNNVYVSFYRDTGKSVLYSVNIKSRKKRIAAKDCCAFAGKGKYIYGNPYKVSDSGAYPVRIWKIEGNSLKKGKTIGNYISGTTIIKNKVYYASYPNQKQKKMTVYCCNLDGTHRKKLFTLKGKGKYCQVLLYKVTKKKIKATVSGDTVKWYEYNIKTGKLKER